MGGQKVERVGLGLESRQGVPDIHGARLEGSQLAYGVGGRRAERFGGLDGLERGVEGAEGRLQALSVGYMG